MDPGCSASVIRTRSYDIDVADDNQQKSVMQSQFTMFWNDGNVKGVTIWGYVVGQTPAPFSTDRD